MLGSHRYQRIKLNHCTNSSSLNCVKLITAPDKETECFWVTNSPFIKQDPDATR